MMVESRRHDGGEQKARWWRAEGMVESRRQDGGEQKAAASLQLALFISVALNHLGVWHECYISHLVCIYCQKITFN